VQPVGLGLTKSCRALGTEFKKGCPRRLVMCSSAAVCIDDQSGQIQ